MNKELKSIYLDNLEIKYLIIRKNIKNIYFRFKNDYILYVSCHHLISDKYIEKTLLQNKDAIIKLYTKIKPIDNNIYYLGNKLNLITSNKLDIDQFNVYAPSTEYAKKYIHSLALNIFKQRMKLLLNNFDSIPEFSLKARLMTSKWGVCNKKSMSITLNKELITKDVSLIDYVIIHELCHFKYMNHSKDYWNYVERFYPYYKKARKELNY